MDFTISVFRIVSKLRERRAIMKMLPPLVKLNNAMLVNRNAMRKFLFFIIVFSAATGCKTLLLEEQFLKIKEFEKSEYTVIEDVTIGEKSLKKNDRIKIIISKGDEWIKVVGYLSNVDRLKAERVRLMYIFDEDFPDKKFDIEFFKKKLFALIIAK